MAIQHEKFLRLDRRKFLGVAAGLIAAGVLPKSVLALAGPYSFKQGSYDITIVSDGTLTLPLAVVSPDATPEEIKALVGAMAEGDKFRAQLNAVLAKSANDTILIDTGVGAGYQETSGKLAENLKAAGIDPGTITKVIYTHGHPDHLWGTAGADGVPIFPNASFHVAEAEWNFWTAPDLASKMPKEMTEMVKGIQGEYAAIKDKVTFFKPGAELVSGLAAIDTAGHTPGHVSFEFAGGDGLIVTGDAIIQPTVFLAHPDWKFGFDADGATASVNRRKLLDQAAAGKKTM
ncbi:MAG TPA: MBL fold metallo-hydrolase, partial [Aestuariivirga sp.]|nr:MBL fold metallo-hydrolase [Aestuariivirga sp.]